MRCDCYLQSTLTETEMYQQFPATTLGWQSLFHADGRTDTNLCAGEYMPISTLWVSLAATIPRRLQLCTVTI